MAAEAQAQADGSETIAPHHLLLALAAVPGPVGWGLATAGADEARLRDALQRRCGVPRPPGDTRVPLRPDPERRVRFAPITMGLIAAAGMVADRAGRPKIVTADLAVSVLTSTPRMPEIAQIDAVLADLGIDPIALARTLRA
jgi:hypothetical protein